MSDLKFSIARSGSDDTFKEVSLTAFVFDSRGRYLDSKPVKGADGSFKISRKHAQGARIFIGPTPPDEKERGKPTLESMSRWHAYEISWEFDPEKAVYELMPIPDILWPYWLWCRCRVRGKVVRPIKVGDHIQEMPVCHARVHICEVDPFLLIIPRLPERDLFRLRDDLIELIRKPIPPIPDPGPYFRFDPGIIDPSPQNLAEMNSRAQESLELAGLAQVNLAEAKPVAANLRSDRIAGLQTEAKLASPEAVPASLTRGLASNSPLALRETVLDHIGILYPYFCYLKWFWPYLRCDEVAVVYTDKHGNFDTSIYYLCSKDHPDLYFWVEYCIGGAWETVYHPPIHCFTHWNYPCGSEVTISIYDPRVTWCGDPNTVPGKGIAVMTIGNNVSMAEILNAGPDQGQTTAQRPFGGSLEPHVWFGEGLIPNHITHYLWSYRKAGTATWHAIDAEVVRHHSQVLPGNILKFKAFPLGPEPVPNVNEGRFKIQPAAPPTGSWAPMVDARANTASAFFRSHLLAGGDALAGAGKYELKLELFKDDGTRVNFGAEGIDVHIPTDPAPFGNTEPNMVLAPALYRYMEGADWMGFTLILHVDNNPCQAVIYPVSVVEQPSGTVNTSNPCGFVSYSNRAADEVDVRFRAYHPNNFADFSFRINKGSTGTVESAAGRTGDSPLNGYQLGGGIYRKMVDVSHLLGACPDKAAFAETLDVDARATDGWNRLSYLDRNGIPHAFALEPK